MSVLLARVNAEVGVTVRNNLPRRQVPESSLLPTGIATGRDAPNSGPMARDPASAAPRRRSRGSSIAASADACVALLSLVQPPLYVAESTYVLKVLELF